MKESQEENQELRSTFAKTSAALDSFKGTTNFRLNLFQSKEAKQINDFFTKYLSPSNQDELVVAELGPMKALVAKLREEITILKKQVDSNPLYV